MPTHPLASQPSSGNYPSLQQVIFKEYSIFTVKIPVSLKWWKIFNLTVPALALVLPFVTPEFTIVVKLLRGCSHPLSWLLSGRGFLPVFPRARPHLTVEAVLHQWAGRLLSLWDREHFTVSHFKSLLLSLVLVLETKTLLWQCLRFWCVCTFPTHLCSTSHPNWRVPSWSPTYCCCFLSRLIQPAAADALLCS